MTGYVINRTILISDFRPRQNVTKVRKSSDSLRCRKQPIFCQIGLLDDPKRSREDTLVWNLANEMEIIIKNKFDLLPITRQLEYFNIIQLN